MKSGTRFKKQQQSFCFIFCFANSTQKRPPGRGIELTTLFAGGDSPHQSTPMSHCNQSRSKWCTTSVASGDEHLKTETAGGVQLKLTQLLAKVITVMSPTCIHKPRGLYNAQFHRFLSWTSDQLNGSFVPSSLVLYRTCHVIQHGKK